MPKTVWFALVSVILSAPELGAQNTQDTAPTLVTRTIMLRHLRAGEAAKLVSPYVRSPRGGVYDAGTVQAVTVIEVAPIVAVMDSVIRENDVSPVVLGLRFQLIAADDSPARDPAIDSLDVALRGLFTYKGYHLLGQGTATAGAGESFSLTMAGGEARFSLAGDVMAVPAGAGGSVRIRIRLAEATGRIYQGKAAEAEVLMTTGLTVPLGQTVVLGSAAPGGKSHALIPRRPPHRCHSVSAVADIGARPRY